MKWHVYTSARGIAAMKWRLLTDQRVLALLALLCLLAIMVTTYSAISGRHFHMGSLWWPLCVMVQCSHIDNTQKKAGLI